jgi:hypothetical protein
MNEGANAARYRLCNSSPMEDSVDSAGGADTHERWRRGLGGVDALCLEVRGMLRADRTFIPG